MCLSRWGKTNVAYLLHWDKTHVASLLHFVAYVVACLGCSMDLAAHYCHLASFLASQVVACSWSNLFLGHVPNPSSHGQGMWPSFSTSNSKHKFDHISILFIVERTFNPLYKVHHSSTQLPQAGLQMDNMWNQNASSAIEWTRTDTHVFLIARTTLKLMTLCRKSNHMDVTFDLVSTIFLRKCFINQACKSYFMIDLENTHITRDII